MRLQGIALLSTIVLVGWTSPPALAAPITYLVTVNTSSALAQMGYIDIQLNPSSFATQASTASITNFMTNGVLNPAAPENFQSPTATGMLPGAVTIANTNTTNEYTEGLTFGTTISFNLTLNGPALTAPNGQGGGLFSLDFLNSDESAYLFTADPQGNNPFDSNVGTVSINGDGSTTVTTYPDANGNHDATFVAVTASPEPSSFLLILSALLATGALSLTAKKKAGL